MFYVYVLFTRVNSSKHIIGKFLKIVTEKLRKRQKYSGEPTASSGGYPTVLTKKKNKVISNNLFSQELRHWQKFSIKKK